MLKKELNNYENVRKFVYKCTIIVCFFMQMAREFYFGKMKVEKTNLIVLQ